MTTTGILNRFRAKVCGSTKAVTDGFTIRPAIFPIIICLFVGLIFSFSPTFDVLMFVVGLFASLIWLWFTFILLIAAAWNRLWRRTASLLAILIFIWPVMVGLKSAAEFASDYLHLALAYSRYASKISVTKWATMPIEFYWGGTGFAGSGNLERSLVYDWTDQTANSGQIDSVTTVSVRRLIGHFYVVERSW